MSSRVTFVRHVNKDAIPETVEMKLLGIPLNLCEFTPLIEDDMATNELCPVLIEAISDEYWDIVHPVVPRGGRQHDPLIVLGDPKEGLNPRTTSHQSLLIEDKEGICNVLVIRDVVPRIDV